MEESSRVLIVEDLPTDAELTEREVRKVLGSCQFQRVETRDGFVAALAHFQPTLIVSDFKLPSFDGLSALKIAVERCADVPFIIVTGSMNEDTAVECMKAGAWDYVIKEHLKRLGSAVLGVLEKKRVRLQQREAEQALRESEEKFRAIFEDNSSAMAIIERDTTISMVNKQYIKISKYEEKNVIGMSWTRQIPPADLARMQEYNRKRLTDPASAPDQYEFRFIRSNGEIRDCYMSVSVIPTSQKIIASFVDITDSKRAATEHEKLQEQLRVAQKIEAIGSLAGGVAHDFNNLLSVILTNTSFALDALAADSPLREDLQEIQTAGQRAATLTRQLLAFSRKQMLRPEVLDCNAVVVDVEKMLRRLIGEDVALAVRPATGLWRTKADRGQLEQVIMNLAVNARDAMPGGGRLTVETANVEVDAAFVERHLGSKPGPHVRLTVTDSGSGMDQTTLVRMFEPFFTTKPAGKGTGLGLATVYGIVKQSGGGIWVDSVVGQGTTFTIHLPRTEDADEEEPRLPKVAPATSGNETVLIVEDEEAVRNVARRILVAAGYQVQVAADGAAALQICAQLPRPVDLLLTDVVMPGMSGRQLVDHLAPQVPQLKVVYMSGYTDNAIVHQGVLDPGTHFIAKPFTREELLARVREALAGGVAPASPIAPSPAMAPVRDQAEVAGQDITALPELLRLSLRNAAIAARCDDLLGLVETVATGHPAIAAELRRRIDGYDYAGILQMLEGGRP